MYKIGQLLQKADNVGTSVNIGGLYVIVNVSITNNDTAVYRVYRMHDCKCFHYTEGSLDHYFISL